MSDREFDALFTRTGRSIFAFHGYPSLIHRLTYRRRQPRQPARARVHGGGHHHDAVRHGDAERPGPLPAGHGRDRPGARLGVPGRGPAAADGRRAAAARARTPGSTARTCRRSAAGPGRTSRTAAAATDADGGDIGDDGSWSRMQAPAARRRSSCGCVVNAGSSRSSCGCSTTPRWPAGSTWAHRPHWSRTRSGDAMDELVAGVRSGRGRCTGSCTAASASPGRSVVDDEVRAELESLVDLAPLHQPGVAGRHRRGPRGAAGGAGGGLLRHRLPRDHAGRGDDVRGAGRVAGRLGVRRYGFHGLSHAYVAAPGGASVLGPGRRRASGWSAATSVPARRCAPSGPGSPSTRPWASPRSRGW